MKSLCKGAFSFYDDKFFRQIFKHNKHIVQKHQNITGTRIAAILLIRAQYVRFVEKNPYLDMMNSYDLLAYAALASWQKKMMRRPSLLNNLSKKIQVKINSWIPEKVHNAITVTIKQMIRGVLFGAKYTVSQRLMDVSLQVREEAVQKKINQYKKTAAVEGGVTGAGGILLGLADFPILIAIKLKLLFEIAALYGFDVNDYKERVYLLHIFELAFSSDVHRKNIYLKMSAWDDRSRKLPEDIHQFDWRNFQQEYRDYIDIAKMAQLVPVIGAPVGVLVNYRLVKKLGITAMNAYRMRLINPS